MYIVRSLPRKPLTGNSTLKHETCSDWEPSNNSLAPPQRAQQLSTPPPCQRFQQAAVLWHGEADCRRSKTNGKMELPLTHFAVTALGLECRWCVSRLCSFIFRTETSSTGVLIQLFLGRTGFAIKICICFHKQYFPRSITLFIEGRHFLPFCYLSLCLCLLSLFYHEPQSWSLYIFWKESGR